VIVVHVNSIQSAASEQPAATIVQKRLDADEAIPLGAIWIDLVDPTVEEDRKVEDFIGGTYR
jgi:hypothetical protein